MFWRNRCRLPTANRLFITAYTAHTALLLCVPHTNHLLDQSRRIAHAMHVCDGYRHLNSMVWGVVTLLSALHGKPAWHCLSVALPQGTSCRLQALQLTRARALCMLAPTRGWLAPTSPPHAAPAPCYACPPPPSPPPSCFSARHCAEECVRRPP